MKTVSLQRRKISQATSILGAVALGCLAFLSILESAKAATVVLGSDYWVTLDNSFFDFGGPLGQVNFVGQPIGTFQGRNVDEADTIIQRKQDVTFNNGFGITDIEVVALSLKSKDSVKLNNVDFDIFVTLNPDQQSTGTLIIKENHTFVSDFNVFWTATFKPTNGGDAIPCPLGQGGCDQMINLGGTGPWSSNKPLKGIKVEGFVGDQLANVHTDLSNDQIDFFPGVNDKGELVGITHNADGAGHHNVGAPEPITILGSGIALGFGAWLQRDYSKKRKKA